MGIKLTLFALMFLSILAAPCRAAEPVAKAHCVTYDHSYDGAPLFKVQPRAGETKVFLMKERVSCPSTGSCPARQKAYLVLGDVVFAGAKKDGFRCAYYGTAMGKIIAGFLPADTLAPYGDEPALNASFLVGKWTDGETVIDMIAAGGDRVKANGSATWDGGDGNVHEGQFEGEAIPKGAEIVFSSGPSKDDCIVKLMRRGPYLVATDNSLCGGVNVRFRGILAKKH